MTDPVLKKLRQICLALPETSEVKTWGHPTFRVGKRTFAVFEQYRGQWCICFKTEKQHKDLFLNDHRFFSTPYIGKHGWLSPRVEGAPDWTEVKELILESYRLVAPAKR